MSLKISDKVRVSLTKRGFIYKVISTVKPLSSGHYIKIPDESFL